MTAFPAAGARGSSKRDPRAMGMDILNPSLRDVSYLDCRRRAEILREEAARLPGRAGVLLDVGGRGRPYSPLFEGRVAAHVVVDLSPDPTVDVVADAARLPLADATVDVVLCTQMLEYAREPARIAAEFRRVLKPGGRLFVAAPGIYPLHASPEDLWRFTPDGIRWLLSGFREVRVLPEAGTVASFFVVFNLYVLVFGSVFRPLAFAARHLLYPVSNLLGLALGRWHRGVTFNSNFVAVAVR